MQRSVFEGSLGEVLSRKDLGRGCVFHRALQPEHLSGGQSLPPSAALAGTDAVVPRQAAVGAWEVPRGPGSGGGLSCVLRWRMLELAEQIGSWFPGQRQSQEGLSLCVQSLLVSTDGKLNYQGG